jgi:hypothetical protein
VARFFLDFRPEKYDFSLSKNRIFFRHTRHNATQLLYELGHSLFHQQRKLYQIIIASRLCLYQQKIIFLFFQQRKLYQIVIAGHLYSFYQQKKVYLFYQQHPPSPSESTSPAAAACSILCAATGNGNSGDGGAVGGQCSSAPYPGPAGGRLTVTLLYLGSPGRPTLGLVGTRFSHGGGGGFKKGCPPPPPPVTLPHPAPSPVPSPPSPARAVRAP